MLIILRCYLCALRVLLRRNRNLTTLCYVKRNSSGKRLNKSTIDEDRAIDASSSSSSSVSSPIIIKKNLNINIFNFTKHIFINQFFNLISLDFSCKFFLTLHCSTNFNKLRFSAYTLHVSYRFQGSKKIKFFYYPPISRNISYNFLIIFVFV